MCYHLFSLDVRSTSKEQAFVMFSLVVCSPCIKLISKLVINWISHSLLADLFINTTTAKINSLINEVTNRNFFFPSMPVSLAEEENYLKSPGLKTNVFIYFKSNTVCEAASRKVVASVVYTTSL